MDDSVMKAMQWAMLLPGYRGSPRVDEALELLRENDYQTLLKAKAKHVRGPLTWASVSAVVVKAISGALLEGDLARALDAAQDAHTLAARLVERDRHVHARVTAQVRQRIGQLDAVASCLEAAAALRDGKVPADDVEALGRLVALAVRWHALRREMSSGASTDWVLALVQAAVGTVLTSDETGVGAKAMASRALAGWVPATPPQVPAAAPAFAPAAAIAPAAAAPAPAPAAPPAKRIRLSDGPGEAVAWTDDDDDLLHNH